jgi:hypothetical protein
MAGKYTRQSYDNEAYGERMTRSTDPMLYRLDTNFAINNNKCFSEYGPFNGQPDSIAIGQQIDVDSVLRGFNRPNGKSNSQQIPESLDQFKLHNYPNCSSRMEPEYSRFTHPAYDIRGMTTSDLNLSYPLHDPQCQIFENFAVNTKLQAKDNHKTVWQVPLDQSDLLPTSKLGNPKNYNRKY